MDIGSVFLILGVLMLVILYISQPLMRQNATVVTKEEHEYSALLAERDRILNALQELDFDHSLGKIPDESYPLQRAVLLKRGADILRKLDEFQGSPEDTTIDARLEAEIESRRVDSDDHEDAPTSDEDIETMIANRRRARKEKSGGFCPQCGNPVQQSDRFCPKCGEKL